MRSGAALQTNQIPTKREGSSNQILLLRGVLLR
jgi:hypothetical protein